MSRLATAIARTGGRTGSTVVLIAAAATALALVLAAAPARAQPADVNQLKAPVPPPPDQAVSGPQAPPAAVVAAESAPGPTASMEIYGAVMTDFGYNAMTIDPDWFDVMRPSKLPSSTNEFGKNGNWFAGVRQTRFGVKGEIPTWLGELKTTFEWELFGVGVDAGQTTFRLRHAYAQLGHFGVGQFWSPFMDIDVFPNSIEYWGPNGMVFFRNVQVRWMPIMGEKTFLTFALEKPGAAADLDALTEVPALMDVRGRFPAPDVSAEFRYGGGWGYAELAGIFRYLTWDDLGTDAFDLGGHAFGWGVNASSNIKLGEKNVIKLQAVYGRGIQAYMNDGGVDVGVKNNPGDPTRPFVGEPLPIFGGVAFLDLYWTKLLTSSVGYSYVHVWSTDAQPGASLESGHYALADLLVHPTDYMLMGGEVQFGRRVAFDGFSFNDVKVQFSFKYSFSQTIGGKK